MSASSRKRNAGGQKNVKELASLAQKQTKLTPEPTPPPPTAVFDDDAWTPAPYTVFKIVMSARLCAAAWNIVGDCDETFNYWEPTHYLMFGKGFQTWEYSPVYAIRSYAYVLLHTLPMKLYGLVFTPNPIYFLEALTLSLLFMSIYGFATSVAPDQRVMLFFFTRCALALTCTLCEVYFYKGVWREFGSNVARIMLCFQLFCAGMFISCTSYLPSSFCMYMTLLSMGAWYQEKYEVAIMSTAASVILGWPFAGILGLPIAFDIVVRKRKIKLFILWSALALVTFLIPLVQVDQYYYGKLLVAPLNIVLYNVFTDHGPDLYGVEPFSYYIFNGILNFNVGFILALVSLPFVLVTNFLLKKKHKGLPAILSLLPMYLWLLVFMTQPHKEERFLFPIYPFFLLGAAVSVDYLQRWWDHLFPNTDGANYAENTSLISVFFGIFFSLLSISRVVAVYQGYHAPLDVYVELNKIAGDPKIHTLPDDRTVNVCVGKEWYRFPGSFFLPGKNWNLLFLQSEFKGQLPKPYSSEPYASRLIPTEMNDINKEEPSRYVNITKCHYLVDLDVPSQSNLEPRYSEMTDEWKILVSIPFIDASRSHQLFRAFYIPFVSSKYCVYHNYNLMKTTRTKKSMKARGTS